MPDAGKPLATNTRQLDHLSYVEKLRHWMRPDAWEPDGNTLRMDNMEISRSSIRMEGGNIAAMPFLIGRPCFGIATAYLPYRDRQRAVKGRGKPPTGRCHTCKSRKACDTVVFRRLSAEPAITTAWTEWLQHDGPRAFQEPDFKGSHVARLWSVLYRTLLNSPFTSANDEKVEAEYARRDTEKRKAERVRKEKHRLAARKKGTVDDLDNAALEKAMLERRGRLALAEMHPNTPKELDRVPPQSISDLLDVWLGRETLRLRRMKPNAPNIARWIVATGRSNRSKDHAALASRVVKDLQRLASFERIQWDGEALIPPLDVARELPSTIPPDAEPSA